MPDVEFAPPWPSDTQRLLLSAAISDKSLVADSWQAWRERVDFDDLEYTSVQLIPRLCERLKTAQPDEPLLPRMKAMHKELWITNEYLARKALVVLELFERNNIDCVVFKGAAMQRYCSDESGLRSMRDIDILIRNKDIRKVVEVMECEGWRTEPYYGAEALQLLAQTQKGIAFTSEGGIIDIHWNTLHQDLSEDSEREIWENAEAAKLLGQDVLVPAATEQFFIMCVHALRWGPSPNLIWISDALVLINSEKCKIDWSRLKKVAQRKKMERVIYEALRFLSKEMSVDLPREADCLVAQEPGSWVQKMEFIGMNISPNKRTLFQQYIVDFMRVRRTAPRSIDSLHLFLSLFGIKLSLKSIIARLVGINWRSKRYIGSRYPGFFLSNSVPGNIEVFTVAANSTIRFSNDGEGLHIALQGWSGTEPEFTWAEQREARLLFAVDDYDPDENLVLDFFVSVYLPSNASHTAVDVLVNGIPLERWVFAQGDAGANKRSLLIPPSIHQLQKQTDVAFQSLRRYSPARGGGSWDNRHLGVCLHTLSINFRPRFRYGQLIEFSENTSGVYCLESGWWAPEDRGTWSKGRSAVCDVLIGNWQEDDIWVEFTIDPYAPMNQNQIVSVSARGQVVGSWCFTQCGNTTEKISIASNLIVDGRLVLEWAIDSPAAPSKLEQSADTRELGIMLISMNIRSDSKSV